MAESKAVRQIPAEQTRPLRQALLRQGVPLEKLVYDGDTAPASLHLGAFLNGDHVGIATVVCQPPSVSVGVPDDHPQPGAATAWRIRGMATTPAAQGLGLGGMMLRACIAHVARQGGSLIWCDARVAAVGFYQTCGFVVLGTLYQVPDVGPHYFMQRDVSVADVTLAERFSDE